MNMKATMILFLVACGMASAQDPPQSRQWLRVGLLVDEFSPPTQKEFQDLFTRQLRKLGDVEVVPLSDHYPLDSGEVHDVRLRVLVSETHSLQEYSRRPAPARRYAIAVIVSRPVDKAKQTVQPDAATSEAWQKGLISMQDLQKEIVAASWLVVADEKDLESTCANLISKIDHEVLEADRKRIRFPEPAPPEPRGFGRGGRFGPEQENNATNHCDVVPSVIYKVEAEYSEEASKAKYQGTVVLSVVLYSTTDADASTLPLLLHAVRGTLAWSQLLSSQSRRPGRELPFVPYSY